MNNNSISLMLSKRQIHGIRVARSQGWEGGLQGTPLESFLRRGVGGTALFPGGRGDYTVWRHAC